MEQVIEGDVFPPWCVLLQMTWEPPRNPANGLSMSYVPLHYIVFRPDK